MSRENVIEVMARAMCTADFYDPDALDLDGLENWKGCINAARAALAALEAAGVRLVPVEATSPMVEQGAHHAFARWMPNESVQDSYDIARAQWTAMLAASPYAPEQKP